MNKFINSRNFILGSKTVSYHSCPKNACTSTKSMILRIFGDKRNNKTHRPWPHTVIACSEFMPVQSEIKFCVVRDPVRRFVSGYTNRVLHYKEIPYVEFGEFLSNFDFYYKNYSAITWHLSPQTRFLGKDSSYYTNIFNTSEIDKVADLLANLSGVDVSPEWEQTGGSDKKPILNEEQIQTIKKIYKEDYEIFGDYF